MFWAGWNSPRARPSARHRGSKRAGDADGVPAASAYRDPRPDRDGHARPDSHPRSDQPMGLLPGSG